MNAPTTPGERAFRLTAAVAGEMALTQQRGRATAAQVKDWSERLHWAASIVPPPYAYSAYGPPRRGYYGPGLGCLLWRNSPRCSTSPHCRRIRMLD